jgi:putative peptidoglycan lipid II flippase
VTFTFAVLVLGVITLGGVFFSSEIVRVIAPGFYHAPEKFQLTAELNRIMFPYIFFISLVALASGILNSLGHFGAPAAAPSILNIVMIGSVAVFSTQFGVQPYYALAWAVVVAGVLQLLLQVPYLRSEGIRLRPDFHFRHSGLRGIGRLFVPAAFGGAVYQINVMIGTILASLLPAGGVSWLYYADRLVELPLGMFAVALGTAVLPSMSRQAANGDLNGLRQSVSFSLRLIAFFTIPASAALIILREPIIACLFQRGKFTLLDTQQTAVALLWYTVGLWAFSGLKVVTQAFFSLKDTRTPVWASIVALIVNVVAGLLLMGPMAQGGLALATSLAAAFNVVFLFIILVRRLGGFPSDELFSSLMRITAAAAVMSGVLVYGRMLADWSGGLTPRTFGVLSGCIFGGMAAFALAAYLFRCRELQSLVTIARNWRK